MSKIKTESTKKTVEISAIVNGENVTANSVKKCVGSQVVDSGKCQTCKKQSENVYLICEVKTAEAAKIAEVEEKKAAEKAAFDALSSEEKEMVLLEKQMAEMRAKLEEKKAAIAEKKRIEQETAALAEKTRIESLAGDICYGIEGILSENINNIDKIKMIALAINQSSLLKIETQKKRVVKSGTRTRRSTSGAALGRMTVALEALHLNGETPAQAAETLRNSEIGQGMSEAASKKFIANCAWALKSKLGNGSGFGADYFEALETTGNEPENMTANNSTINVFRNFVKAWENLGC
jgi:hypothetical protein